MKVERTYGKVPLNSLFKGDNTNVTFYYNNELYGYIKKTKCDIVVEYNDHTLCVKFSTMDLHLLPYDTLVESVKTVIKVMP